MAQKKRTVTPLRIAMILVLIVGVYLFIPQFGAFKDTFTVLGDASIPWLAVGLIASTLTFFAGAVTQYAAGDSTGRFSDIVLLQFAGSFVNHFLPFSLGGVNLNAQYYQKHHKRQAEAITMATIPIIFGVITTILIVAVVSPVTLTHFVGRLHPDHPNRWVVGAVAAALFVGIIMLIKFWRQVKKYLKDSVAGLKGIIGPERISMLTAGSVAITVTYSLALITSIWAVHGSISLVAVFVIYVTSSLVSNVAPTPGGIGATEAVIVLGLVAAHVSLDEAAASTLLFRLLTFWLPIIPGAIALRYVHRRKIV